MKQISLHIILLLISSAVFSQAGHIMQGVGAVNMSMGGAATGQPLDISGALQWNPAAISTFDTKIVKLDVGAFTSYPILYSTAPEMDANGMPTGNSFSGKSEDVRPTSPMPALAFVMGKEDSKHTFGASVFGISGFGVTFQESMTNPITMPQSMSGFGRIESDYSLMQIGIAYAYEITEKISVGIQPTFNYASLELMPNPTADPSMTVGYPTTDRATTTGFGAQIGVFFDSQKGFKAGLSYKSLQNMDEFELKNTYLDNSTSTNNFDMDYPSIISLGLGYSKEKFDIALDYRMVDYKNTNGFSETGWSKMGSVVGFGWENVSIISAGFQYKGINKLPLRLGYTYSSNPITEEVAFYNVPATAIIAHAVQVGLSYEATEKLQFDAVFHYGMSSGKTTGQLLNPQMIPMSPPYGAVPGSEVSYEMTTNMIMFGASYTFGKKAVSEPKPVSE